MTTDLPPIPPAVQEFYTKPVYVGDWHQYKVYCQDYGKDAPAIGLPQFVFYKDGQARLSSEEEAFAFIKESPEDNN